MTSQTPATCPTCGTALIEGATRCPGCGRVFGEINRCPHCHAIAAVMPRGGGFVCAACSKPRERRPGTTVIDAGTLATASGAAGRAGLAGLRTLGAVGVAAGILLAIVMAMLIPGGLGITLAIVLGAAGVGVGTMALKAASQAGTRSNERARADQELAVLELAEKKNGRLTVTDVARGLSISTADADDVLTRLAQDPNRVSVDVDSEGVLRFVFLDIEGAKARGPRMRVDESAMGEPAIEEPAAEEEGNDAELSTSRAEREAGR